MSRTLLSPERRSETKKMNIGKVIIFCEGKTHEIVQSGSIEKAVDNAKALEQLYEKQGENGFCKH